MKKSLQEIEDSYVGRGYRGGKLRGIFAADSHYQQLLNGRKKNLTKKFPISPKERKNFVLSTNEDYEILSKIRQLSQKKLSIKDREIISLLKSQLEHDWRRPLMKFLDVLDKKYSSG